MFELNEMCDGMHCCSRDICARYMGNCDIDRCYPWVIGNLYRWPYPKVCPYWLEIPNENYPTIPKDDE